MHAVCVRAVAGPAEAVRLLASLAEDQSRVLGPDHRDSLRSRQLHAMCVGESGDAAEARRLLEALAADTARVLGPRHPDTRAQRKAQAFWSRAYRRRGR